MKYLTLLFLLLLTLILSSCYGCTDWDLGGNGAAETPTPADTPLPGTESL